MRIELFLDDGQEPIKVVTPPEKFTLDTENMTDGPHQLTLKCTDTDGVISQQTVEFKVQNGPAISVYGIKTGDILAGPVQVLVNAYRSKVGDEFEPERIESPTPIPTWAWVLCLVVFAWGAGYLSSALTAGDSMFNSMAYVQQSDPVAATTTETATLSTQSSTPSQQASQKEGAASWVKLGEQVYGNNCSSCHQATGAGLPGVFPPLKGNSVVLADDPTEHIKAVLHGVSNKVIDGVKYPSPMPPFGATLTDEEVAAVVNHERTQWGNAAKTIQAEDVAKLRQ